MTFRSTAQRAAGVQVAHPVPPFGRLVAALLLALALSATGSLAPRPALAYNCVNVVLRDPYWGQYRRIVESGWNAAGIGGAFAAGGFAVNHAPQVGDIMVWPPNYFGASSTGHVGVVAAVNGNGTVTVRHENWPYGSPEHSQVFTVLPGHQFVHRAFTAAGPAAAPAGDAAGPDVPADGDPDAVAVDPAAPEA